MDRSGCWFETMCNSDVSIVNFQRIDRYAFHFVRWSQSLNPIKFVLYMLLLYYCHQVTTQLQLTNISVSVLLQLIFY